MTTDPGRENATDPEPVDFLVATVVQEDPTVRCSVTVRFWLSGSRPLIVIASLTYGAGLTRGLAVTLALRNVAARLPRARTCTRSAFLPRRRPVDRVTCLPDPSFLEETVFHVVPALRSSRTS